MNLLNKKFGKTGVATIDLDATGLKIVVSDSEKISDQSINETIKPDVLVDTFVSLLGSPSWLVGIGTFVKAELATLAAPSA